MSLSSYYSHMTQPEDAGGGFCTTVIRAYDATQEEQRSYHLEE